MSQSNPTKFGTESWKRMSAILLVAVMVIMVGAPMVTAELESVDAQIVMVPVTNENMETDDVTLASTSPDPIPNEAEHPLSTAITTLTEDFEGGLGAWTTEIINPSSEGPTEWEIGDPLGTGPGTAYDGTNCAGTNIDNRYYRYDADITLVSPHVELGASPQILNFYTWYDTHTSSWGCVPDGGFVEIDNGGGWTQIYPNGGYPESGSIGGYSTDGYAGDSSGWEFCEFDLSAYAGQEVQIRFHFATDSCQEYWGWYVDDVYIGSTPQYSLELTPKSQAHGGAPGTTVDYLLTLTSTGLNADIYSLSSTSVWPVTFFDMGMNPITEIGPLAPLGGNDDFIARVSVDGAALPGDFDIADIIATSQGDPLASDTAQVETNIALIGDLEENFEDGWGQWTTEILNKNNHGIVQWEISDPAGSGPGTAYEGTNCAGTNINDYYYSYPNNADITLNSPYVELGTGSQTLNFYTWYNMYQGCDDVDGGFVEIDDGGGWTQIYPNGGYPNSGTMGGYNTDGYSGTSSGWNYYEFDLSAYASQVVQIRFHFTAQSCREYWGWYVDDVYIGVLPAYRVELTPKSQAYGGVPGTAVDYLLTVTNTGLNADTFKLSSTSVWPVAFLDLGMNPITQIGPLAPLGGNDDFIACVSIPGGASPGHFDIADIIATAQADPLVSNTAKVETNVAFTGDWTEDFEDGWGAWTSDIIGFGPTRWEIGDPAGTGPETAYQGSNCAGTNIDGVYYRSGVVEDIALVSPYVELGAGPQLLKFYTWYDFWREGCARDGGFVEISNGGPWTHIDPIGSYPDSGDIGGYWVDGYAGTSSGWEFYEFDLSAYAGQVVQIRFHFAESGGCDRDRYGMYVDDVYMGAPPAYELDVMPESQMDYGTPGTTVDYTLTVTNTGPNVDTYDLSSTSIWPVSILDMGMNPITQIGPLAPLGGNDNFIARVSIPGGAPPGDFDIADIIATSQADPSVSDTAQVNTLVPFIDFSEDFEDGWGAWTNDIIGSGQTRWEIGDPAGTGPGTAYQGSNCAGTNIDGVYYRSGVVEDIALVSPYVELGAGSQLLKFYTWYDFWREGCANHRDAGFVEISNGGPWTHIDPTVGYPDSGGWMGGYWVDGYAGTSSGWEFYEFDLSAYAGQVVQIRFHFAESGGCDRNRYGMYVDDIYIGSTPQYEFQLTPYSQSDYGVPGTNVDYTLTVTNIGSNADRYDLSSTSVWPVTFYSLAMNPITQTAPVNPGNSRDFIARVSIPGGASQGDLDTVDIIATSQADTLVSENAEVKTQVPFIDFSEDFEDGWGTWTSDIIGSGPTRWEIGDPAGSGPGTAYEGTNCAGTNIDGVYYRSGVVEDIALVSPYVELGAGPQLLKFYTWYDFWREGCARDGGFVEISNGGPWTHIDPIGSYPDSGDIGGYWVDGYAGTSSGWEFYEFDLSAYAGQVVQIRFHFAESGGCDRDRYGMYVDDVYMGVLPAYRLELTPESQTDYGAAGTTVDYTLTVTNIGSNVDTYRLSSASIWPVTFLDMGMNPITQIGPLAPLGGNDNFIARVSIPGGASQGDLDTADIIATSQADTLVSESVQVKTNSLFTGDWTEDFEDGWGTWTTEIINPSSDSPTEWEIGDPLGTGPGTAYEGTNCAGTNIDDRYHPYYADITLVSPYLELGMGHQVLSFHTWYKIFYGCWGADRGFVEINDGTGWTQIRPYGGYPTPSEFSGGSSGWDYYEFDLSAYAGQVIQIRFHFTSDSCRSLWGWYIDDIEISAPPYDFQVDPPVQTVFGWYGDYVDHFITIENTGATEDFYLLMYENADWLTRFYTIDLTEVGIYNGIDDGSQTWWIGPILPGETKSFNARVCVHSNIPGDLDHSTIRITSVGDSNIDRTVDIITRTSMPAPFYDDFELAGTSGVFGRYDGGPLGQIDEAWTRTDNLNSGVNADTSYSGTYSMYTCGQVEITSTLISTEGLPSGGAIASCLIKRGDDGFSDYPEFGDDLFVEYIDDNGDWHILDWFFGGGTAGEVYSPLWILPDDALHPRFQLRFSQIDGNPFTGYWHIDDVYVGPLTSAFDVIPPTQERFGGPGEIVDFNLQVVNFNTMHPDIYTLTADSELPVTIWDSTGTWQINSIGPIMHLGGTGDFIVRMEMPGDSIIGNSYTGTVYVTSQLTGVTDTAALIATHPVAKNLDTGVGYNSIQDAVNMASPGDTIFVYSNTLNEFVTIDRPLILIGENKATTIIDNGEFNVVSSNVEISGFTFQNCNNGISLNSANHCLIHDNNFIGNGNAGIWSDSTDNNEIYDNFFEQNSFGIFATGAGDITPFYDDFSVNTGRWAYLGSAIRTGGYCELTPNSDGLAGRIMYDTQFTSGFVAEFDYLAGGGDGADGMTMFFYKEDWASLQGGGSLGFTDGDGTVLGYGIEFDNYQGGTDTSGQHIAIIKDQVTNHLASVDDVRVEDNAWHHAKVIVDDSSITVFVDDMDNALLSWNGVVDNTYGNFGFTAATGGSNNNHWVDNVDIKPLGENIHDNVFMNNMFATISMMVGGHLITNNLFTNNMLDSFMMTTSGSKIYHNDFIAGPATMFSAIDDTGMNQWDDGYPSGGNYWSVYVGVDNFNGPLQNIAGSDGIGDTPYPIMNLGPPLTQDNYPFMNQLSPLSIPGDIQLLETIPYDMAQASPILVDMMNSVQELQQKLQSEEGGQTEVEEGTPEVFTAPGLSPAATDDGCIVPSEDASLDEIIDIAPPAADQDVEIIVSENIDDSEIVQDAEQVIVNTNAMPLSSIMIISLIAISLLSILGYSFKRKR